MLDKLLNTSPQYGIVAPQSNVIPENPIVFEEGTMTGGQLDWTIAENPVLPNLAGTLADALIVWGELDEKRQAMKIKQAETELAGQEFVLEQTLAVESTDYFQSKEFNRFRQNKRPDIPGVDTPFEVQTEEETPRVSMAAMEDMPWSIDDQYKHTAYYEGPAKGKPYRDTSNKLTVGRGHNLDAPGSSKSWSRALPDVDRAAVISGQRELTEEEMRKLYAVDMEIHIDRTKKKFPELDTYPPHIKTMIIDGEYQGFFGYKKDGSYDNTTQAIRRGDWCAAAEHSLSGGSPRGTRRDYHRHVINMEEGMKKNPDRNKDNYYTTVKRYEERKRLLQEMCAASKKGDN